MMNQSVNNSMCEYEWSKWCSLNKYIRKAFSHHRFLVFMEACCILCVIIMSRMMQVYPYTSRNPFLKTCHLCSDISLKTAIFCFINGDILPQKWRYSDIHTHIGDILRVPTWNFDITDFENPIFDTDPPLPGLYLIHRRIEQSTRFRRLIKVSPTNEVKTGNRS